MLKVLKETQYLSFVNFESKGKTRVIGVMNKNHQEIIGMIKWFGRWRQYCFFPSPNTIWNPDCLASVNEVIALLMNERKKKTDLTDQLKSDYKVVGVIAASIEDFLNWKKEQGHEHTGERLDTRRKYECNNTLYIGISRPEHCCSVTVDELIETSKACANPEYIQILEVIRPTIRKKS